MVDHRLISEHDGWDEYTTLKVDVDARNIATITLNRPDKHNAFNDEMIEHLQGALDDLTRHFHPRALVLRGEGKSFSAGADLEWMRRMAEYSRIENMRDSKNMAIMMRTLNYFPHPTIAVVQGAAFGGGVGLAACCDMAVVSTEAVFSLSEVKLGLIPSAISPYVVAKTGEAYARRYFLTGERFPGEEAVRMGLGSILAKPDGLEVALNYLLDRLLEGGQQAHTDAKDLIYYVQDRHMNEDLMMETVVRIADARASDEGREGLTAFLEKRKPAWAMSEEEAAQHAAEQEQAAKTQESEPAEEAPPAENTAAQEEQLEQAETAPQQDETEQAEAAEAAEQPAEEPAEQAAGNPTEHPAPSAGVPPVTPPPAGTAEEQPPAPPPETAAQPEPQAGPEQQPQPEQQAQPDPQPEQQTAPQPEPQPEPQPQQTPAPATAPQPEQSAAQPEPQPQPQPEAQPQPAQQEPPQPEAAPPAPGPQPTPAPTADPAAQQPTPQPTPAPTAAPTPQPTPPPTQPPPTQPPKE